MKRYCQRSAFPLLTPRATSASASLPASSPFSFRARLLSLMKLASGWNWYPCSKVAVDDAGAVGDVAGQAHLGAAVGQRLHVDPELLEERGPVRGVAVCHGRDVA